MIFGKGRQDSLTSLLIPLQESSSSQFEKRNLTFEDGGRDDHSNLS